MDRLDRFAYADHCIAEVGRYIEGVTDGTIAVGTMERLAVRRHLADLQAIEAGTSLYTFDESLPDRVYQFFSRLDHTKGPLARQQFVLSDWECFVIWVLFGWIDAATHLRRFRLAYIQIARKNGKTTFLGGIALYLLAYDQEEGAEIYSAATKRDQAKIVFNIATQMVRRGPLRKHLTVMGKKNPTRILYERTDSWFEPVGADADTLDGSNPHGVVIDELHAHKSRAIWDVFNTGTGARLQPLQAGITTAGNDIESVCFEQRDYSEKVLTGTLADPEYFAFVCELDPDDDWQDEKNWRKGNPNLGISVRLEELRSQARRAAASMSAQNDFRQKRLNEWVQQAERWLNIADWQACPQHPIDLDGAVAYGGLDLSSTKDLTAFGLIFPPTPERKVWAYLVKFWVTRAMIDEAKRERRIPLDAWARENWVEVIEGNVIDYDQVRDGVLSMCERYQVREIGYDPWAATQIVVQLAGEGLNMVTMRQGYQSMTAPSKELERLVTAHAINPSASPVLRWMASNVAVKTDPAGNIKPDRTSRRLKIDGIVAMIMALGRAIAADEAGQASVYEQSGLLSLQ